MPRVGSGSRNTSTGLQTPGKGILGDNQTCRSSQTKRVFIYEQLSLQ
jgi:hypothetical protein